MNRYCVRTKQGAIVKRGFENKADARKAREKLTAQAVGENPERPAKSYIISRDHEHAKGMSGS